MRFRRGIKYNFTGPSYQSRSRALSSQKTKNFYQQIAEEGKEQFVLHSWPGLPLSSTVAGGVDRGTRSVKGVPYRVVDQTLYSFNASGIHTTIGTIPGLARLIMTDDGINLVLVDPGIAVYVYDGTTITQVTNANIVGAIAATFLNNQIIYTKPDFFVVATVGDPTTANGLDQAGAESQPDDLIHAYAFQQLAYMFGDKSIEPFWNSGTGRPPLERIDGQILEVGTAATHSIANTDEALYWLGSDCAIYRASGGQSERVSSTAISNAIEGYGTINDAVGYTLTFEGHNFYILSFPTENKTWALSEELGKKGWFELSSGTNDGIYQIQSHIAAHGKNWMMDADNGNLYTLAIDTYQNNSETIQRQRVGSSIDGGMVGAVGAEIQIDGLKLIMQTGTGLISGQGENPLIALELSFDGAATWVPQGWARIGRLGNSNIQVVFDFVVTCYDCIPRITATDPVHYSVFSATIDIRTTGKR